ncbi:TetR/AcrR family transcriptional regulator [Humibacter sp. RRB41]|uniref:TetR/AcrR family transcriptional regulator n=1 Tax=Humibacter sp. RRB41 TaxID=2919946 RepID=UPI001FAB0406|nr:TetR/AcrR family transcriptional regulator [Humibacter sp. RRB41]
MTEFRTTAPTSGAPTLSAQEGDDAASGGLRARKIAQAKLAVEHAAFTIALERGYEHATVDAICEAADISQRTFFNYFGSKDGVFLGRGPAQITDTDAREFVESPGPLLGDLMAVISRTIVDHEHDADLFAMRQKLAKRSPEFAKALVSTMNSVEESHVALIRERFAAQHRQGDEKDLDDEARMAVSLAIGAMRFVFRRAFDSKTERIRRETLDRAIDLVNRVTTS